MKLHDLKKAAAQAQQDFHLAERKAGELQGKAKAAKAKSEQTRLDHKRARKAAKQAKKLASAAEEQAREHARVLGKVQKLLSKALKKVGQGKGKQLSKPARSPAVARRVAPTKRKQIKLPVVASSPQRPASVAQAPSAAVTPPSVIPTV